MVSNSPEGSYSSRCEALGRAADCWWSTDSNGSRATHNLWNHELSTRIPAFFFGPRLTHRSFLNPHKFHPQSGKFQRLAYRDITELPPTPASQVLAHTFLSANKPIRILQHSGLWQDSTLGARFQEQLHSSWHRYTCSSPHSEQPSRFKPFQPSSFWWLSWLFSV